MSSLRRNGIARLAAAAFRAGLFMGVGLLAASCGPSTSANAADDDASFRTIGLTLYGYNYTDTELGSIEVNGHGGGNVAVSTPTAGGGSSVCCVEVLSPMTIPRTVTVKWTRDGDTWCEQSVELKPPLPARPQYFEVHFYRDGHVEVAVTEQASPPRLKMSREHGNSRYHDRKQNINNDSRFSRCKLGYR